MNTLNIDALWGNVHEKLFAQARLKTFGNWPYKADSAANCTAGKLAQAGFISTATDDELSSAMCVFCKRDLIFDPEDDPWTEHASREPDCPLIRLNKKKESDWLVDDAYNLMKYLIKDELSAELDEMSNTIASGYDDVMTMNEKAAI